MAHACREEGRYRYVRDWTRCHDIITEGGGLEEWRTGGPELTESDYHILKTSSSSPSGEKGRGRSQGGGEREGGRKGGGPELT